MLASRLQRDGSAEGSGHSVVVRIAVQVIAVPRRCETAAIARHLFQHLGYIFGCLVGLVDLRVGIGGKACGIERNGPWLARLGRQHHAVPQGGRQRLAGRLRFCATPGLK